MVDTLHLDHSYHLQFLMIDKHCIVFTVVFMFSLTDRHNMNEHRWELPGNYPEFTVVMVIYHYVERIWRILFPPIFYKTYMIVNIYYTGEPVNMHIQSLITIVQENNWVITTLKG